MLCMHVSGKLFKLVSAVFFVVHLYFVLIYVYDNFAFFCFHPLILKLRLVIIYLLGHYVIKGHKCVHARVLFSARYFHILLHISTMNVRRNTYNGDKINRNEMNFFLRYYI